MTYAQHPSPPAPARLPPATERALRALLKASESRLIFSDFRRAAAVRGKAYAPFIHRLLNASLITHWGDFSGSIGYALTLRGKRALDAHDSAKPARKAVAP